MRRKGYKTKKAILLGSLVNKKVNIKTCGKWILAGEYSVLKSYPALVFPLPSQFIELEYQAGKEKDILQISEESFIPDDPSEKPSVTSFFELVLIQALQKISKSPSDLKGTINLNSCILFGAGMGASAVICVLIGRLFQYLHWLKEKELFHFCHSLENTLHGQSSGVDIAAILTGKPIMFSIKTTPEIQIFHPLWQPPIFLSHSGKNNSTKANIKKIKQFWKKEPQRADVLNRQMAQAVLKAIEGLKMKPKEKGFTLIAEAFSLAEECFFKWNLIGKDMKKHILFLKKQGAVAAKPTGSGSGGCVLSLWPKPPPTQLSNQLISVF